MREERVQKNDPVAGGCGEVAEDDFGCPSSGSEEEGGGAVDMGRKPTGRTVWRAKGGCNRGETVRVVLAGERGRRMDREREAAE